MIIWSNKEGKVVLMREKGFPKAFISDMEARGYEIKGFVNANARSVIAPDDKTIDVIINDAQLAAFLQSERLTPENELALLRAGVETLMTRLNLKMKELT